MPTRSQHPGNRHAGFTLVEVISAMLLYALVVTVALGTYLTALHSQRHTEDSLDSATGIRQATDLIAKLVRSAALEPEITNEGRILRVVPNDVFFVTVNGSAVVDPLTVPAITGVPEGQPVVTFASRARQPAITWALDDTCPDAAIASPGALFIDAAQLPEVDLDDFFAIGDTVLIPGTLYGGADSYVITAIGNDTGSKWLRFDSDLRSPIPDGTQIAATSARRVRFSVEDDGELRCYRDDRDLSRYTVVARNIRTEPLLDPFDASAGTVEPFVYDPDTRTVSINLQCQPAGSAAGRTTMAASTAVRVRTNPLAN